MQVNPYLLFNGNCAEAFKFYEQTLGGTILFSAPFAGSPGCENLPEEFGDKIMHTTMKIGDTLLMASDAPRDNIHNRREFPFRFHSRIPPRVRRSSTRFQKMGLSSCRIKRLSGPPVSACASIVSAFRGWLMSNKLARLPDRNLCGSAISAVYEHIHRRETQRNAEGRRVEFITTHEEST